MSPNTRERTALRRNAPIFAALGDPIRLALLHKLATGTPHSITRLTEGFGVSRQAVTKHLVVLEHAGLVRADRRGRESLFHLKPQPLDEARRSLDRISMQWDVALANLKAFVE